MARWLLPMAIGLPIALGALRLYGERQGLYSGPFGLMLHVVIIIIIFCYIVWRVAVVVNERDELRAKAELDLEQANQLLEHRVEERTLQLKKVGQMLEEKAAQLQLKVKELADYKYAIDQGAIVAITDVKGRITEVNDNFCTISGYARQELIGQDHRIINSGTHPPEFMRNLWVTIANGRVWRGEVCNRAKDGTLYWVDTTIVPFMNAFGKPDHYLAIRAEITERKVAEQKLALSEERFRHTLDNMMEGAQIIGFDWKYQYVNAAVTRHGGLTADKLLGRTMAECYPGIENTQLYGHMQRCMTDRVPHHMENHFQYPDGSTAWFELSIQPVPEGVFILSINMTDRKLAEQAVLERNRSLEQKVTDRTAQLQASNKELESFTYSVSHDLRAPLRAISGFAQMLHQQHAPQLTEEAQRLLGIISTNANTMGQLIDDLLHFSRTGRQQVRYAQVDMRHMAQHTVDDLLVHEPERRLQVQVEPLPTVDADAHLLQHVWTNLISNALKYSAKVASPHIRIWATTNDETVTYHVADNGVGFNMQYADKLFGVFQRLHSPREFEGTGVGLAIVQRIVLKHGGRVWAEAEVDKGATFHFSLPTHPIEENFTPKTIQYEEDSRNTTG